ncbi:MAG TPA: AMP-binding protein [Ktedonobacterales bacterium]|nr:AMP-binding protein [Ktedonobacterales bacterium]
MSTSGLLYEHLRNWAATRPEAPFLIEAETGVTLTYKQSFTACQAMRQHLGAEPRSILLGLPGGIANAIVWLSALTGGHTLIPIAPDAPAQEVLRVTDLFPPDVIIADQAVGQESLGQPRTPMLTKRDCEMLIHHAAFDAGPALPPIEGRACLRTSGSTGQPKSVLLGEQQIAWAAGQVRRSHQLSPSDRGLAVLPFFHVNAPVVSLCASLLAGSSVVIASRFSRSRFWSWIEHYRVTWASIVPTILALVLQTERPAFLPGTLRFVRTASAPLPAIQLLQFERQFGVPVIETYGLTEAGSQVCANPLPPARHMPGSVGKPVGIALRICCPSTAAGQPLQEVAPGETGEICVAGPSVVSGYVGTTETNTFQGSWFRTGDLGYQDAEGHVYLIGRLRETILRGGESIAPREVEEVLLAHPAVREAAVIGRPDALYGEQVVAYLAARETWTEALEQSLRAHCAEHLTKHKVPSAFIPTDALPRTLTGKIDRQRLPWHEQAHQAPEVDIHAA